MGSAPAENPDPRRFQDGPDSSADNERILITLPVFNEALHLGQLITDLRKVTDLDILVIDDGSEDDTPAVLQRVGASCLRHDRNYGKGEALRSALKAARAWGYHWIITMDGDGQHDPAALPVFIRTIRSHQTDFYIGWRQGRGGIMPPLRQISNGLSSVLLSLFAGARFHDAQCGFRAYRTALPGLDACREQGFQYESELLLRLGRLDLRVDEIPIPTRYSGSSSRIRHLRDTLAFLRLLWRSLWW